MKKSANNQHRTAKCTECKMVNTFHSVVFCHRENILCVECFKKFQCPECFKKKILGYIQYFKLELDLEQRKLFNCRKKHPKQAEDCQNCKEITLDIHSVIRRLIKFYKQLNDVVTKEK